MPQSKYTREQREAATIGRFMAWTNFLNEQQAVPVICIGEGHVGDKRSEVEPVYCMPADLEVDWILEQARAFVALLENQKRMRGG